MKMKDPITQIFQHYSCFWKWRPHGLQLNKLGHFHFPIPCTRSLSWKSTIQKQVHPHCSTLRVSVGIRGPYLGFTLNGCDAPDLSVHSRDVTSSLFPFEKSSTSPPSPGSFGYVCGPFLLHVCSLASVVGKGAGKRFQRFGESFGVGTACLLLENTSAFRIPLGIIVHN